MTHSMNAADVGDGGGGDAAAANCVNLRRHELSLQFYSGYLQWQHKAPLNLRLGHKRHQSNHPSLLEIQLSSIPDSWRQSTKKCPDWQRIQMNILCTAFWTFWSREAHSGLVSWTPLLEPWSWLLIAKNRRKLEGSWGTRPDSSNCPSKWSESQSSPVEQPV